MKEKQLQAEFEALARQLDMQPEEVVKLCSDMLKEVNLPSFATSSLEQLQSICSDRKALQEKMHRGARRTHGSFKFSV